MKQPDFPLHPQLKKLRALYLSCIVCKKELDAKRVRAMQPRCKNCERDFAKMWPDNEAEFMAMFEGQY